MLILASPQHPPFFLAPPASQRQAPPPLPLKGLCEKEKGKKALASEALTNTSTVFLPTTPVVIGQWTLRSRAPSQMEKIGARLLYVAVYGAGGHTLNMPMHMHCRAPRIPISIGVVRKIRFCSYCFVVVLVMQLTQPLLAGLLYSKQLSHGIQAFWSVARDHPFIRSLRCRRFLPLFCCTEHRLVRASLLCVVSPHFMIAAFMPCTSGNVDRPSVESGALVIL